MARALFRGRADHLTDTGVPQGVTPTRQRGDLGHRDYAHTGAGCGFSSLQVARRRTSHRVTAMSSTDNPNSQPASIHWNAQNRVAGW
jgi:hypothetical protein